MWCHGDMKSSSVGSALGVVGATICLFAAGCGKQPKNEAASDSARRPGLASRHAHSESQFTFQAPRLFVPSANVAGKDHNDLDYLREWNRFTSVDDYKLTGRTNANWDAKALAALETYAVLRSLPDNSNSDRQRELITEEFRGLVSAALAAGCDDPLVKYLHARLVLSEAKGMTDALMAKSYMDVADALETMPYAPIRKTYVNLRAAQALKASVTNTPPRLMQLRRATVHHLNEALHDQMMPPREAAEVCRQVWNAFELNQSIRGDIEVQLVPTLEKLWPDHGFAHLLKGELLIKKAWDSRGSGYAPTVTEEGWKGFKASLDLAEKELRKAWDLDPKDTMIPISMITICMGQGYPREEMEHWFKRAMEIDPACHSAAYVKATYLEPKWHGGEEDLLEFGRECVTSTKWKGNVPLILAEAHERLVFYEEKDQRASYWLKPGVWEDMRRSYERYFELNPTDISYRHNYAKAAYNCGQPQVFLDQLTRFDGTNYVYFGGREKFDAMIRTAQAKTATK